MDILKIIEELNIKLSSAFQDFEGVYFYGSRQKNTHREDSDVDLVAIFKNVNRNKRMKIWQIVGELEYKYDVILDLHPMTLAELKQNPFYYEQVVDFGKFYEAA
ncbi:MAG: nucleotidyltransferase domain-containing protein [Candidatus Gastranaerophilales bacterium]|nr:nucleotidyltransferase domain-containing protein [Candidatus Gastranaerophilales bacterium]